VNLRTPTRRHAESPSADPKGRHVTELDPQGTPAPRGLEVQRHVPLTPAGDGPAMQRAGLVIGEWSLTGAAWTDLHMHDEINVVLDGELHVSTDTERVTLHVGDRVAVPAGCQARYEAPVHARMLYIYGPSVDGHATIYGLYEDLIVPPRGSRDAETTPTGH
jgi:mannose-6-phosphate isomerase-like protein (cupin superfamily)